VTAVTEIHGEYYFGRSRLVNPGLFRWFVRPVAADTFAKVNRIRVLAAAMKADVEQTYGQAAADKCVVVPTRVNLEQFRMKTEHRKSLQSLITVGSLIPIKGHAALIRSLASACPDVTLTIAGGGPERFRLMETAAAVGLNVRLLGHVSHERLAAELADSDAYVHAAETEAVPRAVLEALATGLPVLTSRCGYLYAEIVDAGCAAVFDPTDPSTLRSALDLIEPPDVRATMGRRARHVAERSYEWNQQILALAQLIQRDTRYHDSTAPSS
jgi:glycosyltransferase involved in cell wall biosynthesis